MGKKEIDERAWSPADPDTVFGLLADGRTWPMWSRIGSFTLRSPGRGDPEGLDAIREFHTGRSVSIERVVARDAGRRFSYILLEGLPLRDYRADVELEPHDGGTNIRWHSTFFPKRPGTGWLYRLILGRFIRGCVEGLAVHAGDLRSGRADRHAV